MVHRIRSRAARPLPACIIRNAPLPAPPAHASSSFLGAKPQKQRRNLRIGRIKSESFIKDNLLFSNGIIYFLYFFCGLYVWSFEAIFEVFQA